MRKTLLIAVREFLATVLTRGFILGVALPLVFMGAIVIVFPFVERITPPPVVGTVAVVDPTGEVLARLELRLADLMAGRQRNDGTSPTPTSEADARLPAGETMAAFRLSDAETDPADPTGERQPPGRDLRRPVQLSLQPLALDTDPEAEKETLRTEPGAGAQRVALLLIAPDALESERPAETPLCRLFVRSTLDDRVQVGIVSAVRQALADARLARHNFDPARIRALMDVPHPPVQTITPSGERPAIPGVRFLVPAASILLLMVAAFTGGQYLLTSTIEEKSNRIMEILLSAATPLQLMAGKIVGQMAVGLVILSVYSALGVVGLLALRVADVLSWLHVLYVIIFFLLAFVTIASFMAAVGSAVSEVHEAQSLIGPLMIVFIVPWLLMPLIVAGPHTRLATTLSLTPLLAPFVMVQRVGAAPDPIPLWQVLGSMLVSAMTAAATIWAAAKIFRIGVLLHGKPPNLMTLIRWIRQG